MRLRVTLASKNAAKTIIIQAKYLDTPGDQAYLLSCSNCLLGWNPGYRVQ